MNANHDAGPIESQLLRDDPEMADLVISFVGGLTQRLGDMARAAAAHELADLRRLAHQLKGAAGGYGYPQLTDLSAELESAARSAAAEQCLAILELVRDMIARIRAGLATPDSDR